MRITIDIPDEHAGLVVRAFATGGDPEMGTTPHGFTVLGGEEFRRLIGKVHPKSGQSKDGTLHWEKGDVDFDSPLDLSRVTQQQGIAVVEACCRAYIRRVVSDELVQEAQEQAIVRAQERAASVL